MWNVGLFSRGTDDGLSPISQERLKQILDREGWRYFVDNEGDLGGIWDPAVFYFMIRGKKKELLFMQSLWRSHPDSSHLEDVRLCIEDWHRDRIWPKCFYRIDDDGDLRVGTEHAIDWEQGATDAQLLQHIKTMLGTSAEFYKALGERLGI